jgi:hypothetical protein
MDVSFPGMGNKYGVEMQEKVFEGWLTQIAICWDEM